MKQILIELDDRCARDLERVAPARNRQRARFIRLALRRAIDLALDLETRDAYLATPLSADAVPSDIEGWDASNALARPARPRRSSKSRPRKAA